MGTYIAYDPEAEDFLNNFYTRFVQSGTENHPEGLARAIYSNRMDTTYAECYRGLDYEADYQDYCAKKSNRYLQETPRTFFKTLDEVISEVGLDFSEIRRLTLIAREGTLEDCLARDEYIRPVYVHMRQMGYNKSELWG